MDQLRIGRWMGRMESRVDTVERDLHDLKTASPHPAEWRPLVPYMIYGAALIGLAITGKVTWLEALKALAP